jgi:hypothetical protein
MGVASWTASGASSSTKSDAIRDADVALHQTSYVLSLPQKESEGATPTPTDADLRSPPHGHLARDPRGSCSAREARLGRG